METTVSHVTIGGLDARLYTMYQSPFGYGFLSRGEHNALWYEHNAVGKTVNCVTGRLAEYLDWLLEIGCLKTTMLRSW